MWGAISSHGLGPLVRIEGRFNAAAFEDIVDSVVIPYALDGPFADGLYYLQHDRSPIHMARSVKHLLDERGVMVIEWPPQGADMNIIENVWGAMKKSLSSRQLQGGSRDALWQAVEEEWQRLRATDFAARLFESIPRRVAAVVSAKGDFTKY